MSITWEEQVKDLISLKECAEDMGMKAEVVPHAGKEKNPALSIELPLGSSGKERTLVCCFLPLEEDQSQFCKYLQMYIELASPLPDEDMPVVLLLINQINQILSVGQCFWRMGNDEEGLPGAIGIRYTLATPLDSPVDDGCFGESIILMADAFDFLDYVLEASKDKEKAKELLENMERTIQEALL